MRFHGKSAQAGKVSDERLILATERHRKVRTRWLKGLKCEVCVGGVAFNLARKP